MVQVRSCPALMVPVAENDEPTLVQSPEKVALTRREPLSTIVKVPGPNVTS
jgi:hypothetical protein